MGTARVDAVECLLQDSKQIRHNRAEKGRKVPSEISDSVYGPEGREFESLRAYQNPRETLCFLRVLSFCMEREITDILGKSRTDTSVSVLLFYK